MNTYRANKVIPGYSKFLKHYSTQLHILCILDSNKRAGDSAFNPFEINLHIHTYASLNKVLDDFSNCLDHRLFTILCFFNSL